MVNGTYICNSIEKIFQAETSVEEKLTQVSDMLKREAQIKGYFCKVWGKRWSFWVGDKDLPFAPNKILFTPTLGFCYEDTGLLSNDDWGIIVQKLTEIFKKLDIE